MPAASVPAFRGRVLEGLRRGSLDERFRFVVGRDAGSAELRVALALDAGSQTVRVTLGEERVHPPSRQREAVLVVDQRSRAEAVDPAICEREPIHIPGNIQAQGYLLAADIGRLTVTVASENISELLGRPAGEILGMSVLDLLPKEAVSAGLRAGPGDEAGNTAPPLRRALAFGEPPRPFDVMLHVTGDTLIVEFEAVPYRGEDFGAARHSGTAEAVQRLRLQSDLATLADDAALILRRMTGFERVLIYRFDDEWNGEAVAESVSADWGEELVGLRFPASDIPRQARELYTRSPNRYVVDRDAAPVPLVSAPAFSNGPLDLSRALFRSVSPVHVEYQRNLGVNGSMSVAIMIEGRLWGLVIGHHRRPHYVAPETRDAVNVVTSALALRIHDLATAEAAREQQTFLTVQVGLLGQMAREDDYVTALTAGPYRLVDLFGATGAAIVRGEHITAIGRAPAIPDIAAVAGWMRTMRPADGSAVALDNLGAAFPRGRDLAGLAGGALAAFVGREGDDLLLWFRPEVTSTVVWSGDPRKSVVVDTRSSAVLPRRSFERWVEERRGSSRPWSASTVRIASDLARAVDDVALRQSRRVQVLSEGQDQLRAAIAEKDALLEQKDLLSREIDHRVKNSLQIVSSFLSMQSRNVRDPDAKAAFAETYARVMSVARVHDSLYQSDNVTEVDLGHTIEALTRDLSSIAGETREVELTAERGMMVPYRKAVALCLIATELVTNALKHAYAADAPGSVEIQVKRHDTDGVQMRVCDQGDGLPADWSSRPKRGLGMQLVRAMLQQIDGSLEVSSASGSCFTVTC